MKIVILSFLTLLFCTASLQAADVSGIKAANLVGAKVDLMHNHDPMVEKEHFKLMDGFEVNLFATEPMLANPIHLGWDAEGRLYVACSWAYPQVKPGETPNDKIITLEDTDGDGRADKSTVFADKLYIPTGIEIANGGVYMAQSPDVLFLKDTDGDGVADVRDVVLTGFGIEDSHHSISAWRRGPGGWIYFQEGIFLHAQVETQYGMVRNFNGGVYQYHPRSQELRVFANIGVGNPWGHVIDEWGQSFLVDNPRVIYLSPGSGAGSAKVRLNSLISTEKQCGGDLISGTHFPPELNGDMLTCRFKSRRIVRYSFDEQGAGYSAAVHEPLISSAHPNFRPVDCKIGPDGALYIADWYNPIINHAQHDFRDARRDHEHGRIWRVTAKGRPLVKKPELVEASMDALLEHLKSPNTWTRHYARLTLSEKDGDQVLAAVRDWVKTLDPADPQHDHYVLEAIWTLQNMNRMDENLLRKGLSAKDGRARAAATRVLRYWGSQVPDPVALIEQMANDAHPRVRLEAVLSAGFISDPHVLPAALTALDHPTDTFIDLSVPQTIAALRPLWEPALQSGTLAFRKPEHRAFLNQKAGMGTEKQLQAVLRAGKGSPQTLQILRDQVKLSSKMVRSVVQTLVKKGDAISPELSATLFDILIQAGPLKADSLGKHVKGISSLLDAKNPTHRLAAVRTAGAWRLAGAEAQLIKIVNNRDEPVGLRLASAEALGKIARPESMAALEQLSAKDASVSDRYLAVQGLIHADIKDAATRSASLLQQDPEGNDPVALVQAFVRRDRGASALGGALKDVPIHDAALTALQEQIRHNGPFPGRMRNLFPSAVAGSLSTRLIREKRDALVADVAAKGNAERGELIYRRKMMACTSCHAIGGAGPKIGPDLAAVGSASTPEYIVESILLPNKAISEHYETVAISKTDGGFHMGVISFQSKTDVVIRDSVGGGSEIRIPRNQIKRTTPMPSLMPANLADLLPDRQAFLDLAQFISQLGRPGPYANRERPVLRTWLIREGKDAALPVYSTVEGTLPLSVFGETSSGQVQTFLTVLKPGRVGLDINEVRGLSLLVNDQVIEDLSKPVDLPAGRVVLEFDVDLSKRKNAGIRVELVALPDSEARFQVQNGP